MIQDIDLSSRKDDRDRWRYKALCLNDRAEVAERFLQAFPAFVNQFFGKEVMLEICRADEQSIKDYHFLLDGNDKWTGEWRTPDDQFFLQSAVEVDFQSGVELPGALSPGRLNRQQEDTQSIGINLETISKGGITVNSELRGLQNRPDIFGEEPTDGSISTTATGEVNETTTGTGGSMVDEDGDDLYGVDDPSTSPMDIEGNPTPSLPRAPEEASASSPAPP